MKAVKKDYSVVSSSKQTEIGRLARTVAKDIFIKSSFCRNNARQIASIASNYRVLFGDRYNVH